MITINENLSFGGVGSLEFPGPICLNTVDERLIKETLRHFRLTGRS